MKTQKAKVEDNLIQGTAIMLMLVGKTVLFLLVYQSLISVFPDLAVLPIWGRIMLAISAAIMGY